MGIEMNRRYFSKALAAAVVAFAVPGWAELSVFSRPISSTRPWPKQKPSCSHGRDKKLRCLSEEYRHQGAGARDKEHRHYHSDYYFH